MKRKAVAAIKAYRPNKVDPNEMISNLRAEMLARLNSLADGKKSCERCDKTFQPNFRGQIY